jgi:hypothetical protein
MSAGAPLVRRADPDPAPREAAMSLTEYRMSGELREGYADVGDLWGARTRGRFADQR